MNLPKVKECDRTKFILEHCTGKRVLHLGCADWPFTEKKAKKTNFLHKLITEVSEDTLGVDISSIGIDIMRNYNIKNVTTVDAEIPLRMSIGGEFDVVVAGEILEHVLNAGALLESIKGVMNRKSILIITTPNFSPIKRIPRLALRIEEVHPDHVYYFSYSTLSKLLQLSGYEIIDFNTHWWDVGFVSKVVNKIFRNIPCLQYYADTLCVSARLR